MGETSFNPENADDIIGLMDSFRMQGLMLGFTMKLDLECTITIKFIITLDILMDMDLRGIDILHHPKVSFFTVSDECMQDITDTELWGEFKEFVFDELQDDCKPFTPIS